MSLGKYLARCREKPLLILRNNEVAGVLLSAEVYRRLVESYELVQSSCWLARTLRDRPKTPETGTSSK